MRDELDFNLYDDYLAIFATSDAALEAKLQEMQLEGWEAYGKLQRLDLEAGKVFLQQNIRQRKPFPGSALSGSLTFGVRPRVYGI